MFSQQKITRKNLSRNHALFRMITTVQTA